MIKKNTEKFDWHYGEELPGFTEVPVLYEYMPLEGIYTDTFEARSLYVPDPKKFNDPFDCWAYIDSESMSPEEYSCFLRQFSKSMNVKFGEDAIEKMTRDYESKGNGSLFLGELRDAFKSVAEALGVLCFSSEWNSFLMWSHYARSHSGICIGYKRNGLRIKGGSEEALPIQYKNPAIHLQKIFHDPSGLITDETAIEFLRTKIQDWEYESEWRLITSKELSGKRIKWNKCGAEVVEVIFGLKTPQEEIEKFVILLRKMRLKVNCVILAFNPVENEIYRFEEFSS